MAKFGVLPLVWCYMSITIVQSYTGKYHEFVTVCIVTSAQKWIKHINVPAFTAFEHSSKVTMLEHKAGGNGTAGTAMAVLVFEREEWRRLDSNLAYVIECPPWPRRS